MAGENRLKREFYVRDVLKVAPDIIGKLLFIIRPDGLEESYIINEVEAYRGAEDLACHVSKGRTARTEVMFQEGGKLYMYFIYGMYWMLNIVTEGKEVPQAVLIRGAGELNGPGKLTRALGMDRSFYGEDLTTSSRIWIEDHGFRPVVKTSARIGVDYAGETWKNKLWRFYI